jgi:hypothetical protein
MFGQHLDFGLVEHLNVRLNAALVHQPSKHLRRVVARSAARREQITD